MGDAAVGGFRNSLKSSKFQVERPLDRKGRASEKMFIIRGAAILLVVIGHVIGDRDEGIRQLYAKDLPRLAQLYEFIYTFHMPIFFLVSGFAFIVFAKANRKLLDFINSRAQRLLIPLLCWAPVYYISRSIIGKIDFRVFGIIDSITHPDFIFWFFPAIFFANILGFVSLSVFRSWPLYFITSTGLFVLSFYITGSISTWFYFNNFYFLGCVIGSYFLKQNDEQQPLSKWKAILIVSCMACMMIFDYFLMASEGLSYLLVKFINGILGFSTLCIIIDSWSKFSLPSFLQPISLINKNIFLHLGQISMSVYLLHVICGSITRNILAQFGILDPNIQFTLGLFISAIGPVLFHRTFHKNRLFLYSIGEAK